MDEDLDEAGEQGGVGRRRKRLLLLCWPRGKLDDRGPRACRARPCLHLHRFGTEVVADPIATRVAQGDALESEGAWRGERKHHWLAHFEAVVQATIGAPLTIGAWDRNFSSGAGPLGGVQEGGAPGPAACTWKG